PRRTVLLEGGETVKAAVPLELADEPCAVLLTATGLLARTPTAPDTDTERSAPPRQASSNAIIASSVASSTRGTIGLITSAGRLVKLSVLDIPAGAGATGTPVTEFIELTDGERVVGLAALPADGSGDPGLGIALGTTGGTVKRVQPDYPAGR